MNACYPLAGLCESALRLKRPVKAFRTHYTSCEAAGVIPQRRMICFMFANLTGRGTSLGQNMGTFGVPQNVQFCAGFFDLRFFCSSKRCCLRRQRGFPRFPSHAHLGLWRACASALVGFRDCISRAALASWARTSQTSSQQRHATKTFLLAV